MRVNRWLLAATLLPLGATAAAWLVIMPPHALSSARSSDVPGPPGPPLAAAAQKAAPAPFRSLDLHVVPGYTLSQTLQDLGLLKEERAPLMDSFRPYIDPAKVAAGTHLKAIYNGPEDALPSAMELRLDETRTVVSERKGPGIWTATERTTPLEKRLAAYTGVVKSTLWNSATTAGMDPQLIQKLAEVFAWQVDFNRGVHEEDRWRLTVERLYADGQPVGWGEIVAAEFDDGTNVYSAVRYEGGEHEAYYTPDGQSLRRLFLKSPLRYAHVTSGFSAGRFHPILKINRPHLGVDYGAPTGTPIMAVGDGTITIAARRGGSGNMIALRHSGLYETEYKHLSAFAKGIVPGAKVAMGQVIGYVGATGLATGPHLHFEFHIGRNVVDPLGMHFPAADPIPTTALAQFRQAAAKTLGELPPWSSGLISARKVNLAKIPHE